MKRYFKKILVTSISMCLLLTSFHSLNTFAAVAPFPVKDINLMSTVNKNKNSKDDCLDARDVYGLEILNAQGKNITYVDGIQSFPDLKKADLNNNHIFDISSLYEERNAENYCEYDMQNQEITLCSEKVNKSLTIYNIITDYNGKPAASITNISNDGVYDPQSNTITWNNITSDTDLSYSFNADVNRNADNPYLNTQIYFSGKVTKHVIYDESTPEYSRDDYVEIKDKHLKEGIDENLNKTFDYYVTKDVLNTITSLSIHEETSYYSRSFPEYKTINSIEGLQYLKNLTSLDLRDNKIEDLTPLKDLTNLTSLNLLDNKITDLSPLKNLKKLSEIKGSTCVDISVNCTSDTFEFKNIIKDIDGSPVAPYDIPTVLEYDGCGYKGDNGTYDSESDTIKLPKMNSDIKAIISYRSPKTDYDFTVTVNVKYTPSAVSKITDENLKNALSSQLNKAPEEINDNDIKGITSLDLKGKQIKSLKGLETFTNLKTLNISDNEIEDLTPLKDLKNLTYLIAPNNKISDIGSVKDLTNLRALNLKYNNITDISPVSNLSKLKYIYLTGNNIENKEVLDKMPGLKVKAL